MVLILVLFGLFIDLNRRMMVSTRFSQVFFLNVEVLLAAPFILRELVVKALVEAFGAGLADNPRATFVLSWDMVVLLGVREALVFYIHQANVLFIPH